MRPKHSAPIYLALGCLFLAGLACTLEDLLESADLPDLVVTKTEDTNDGACSNQDCSLREAVLAANAAPEPNTIFIPEGTYVLSLTGDGENAAATGDLDIIGDLSIAGAGSEEVVVDGNASDRVFHVHSGHVEMDSLTIRNGLFTDGGGINIEEGASAVLRAVNVFANAAPEVFSGARGGGVFNRGTLEMIECQVILNLSTGSGGGIYNFEGASLTISETTIQANSAEGWGGGILSYRDSTLVVSDSLIESNHADLYGGGISTDGQVQITGTTFENNTADEAGGGLLAGGDVTIADSLFTGNSASSGGGIVTLGQPVLSLDGVTFNQNQATDGNGGGLHVSFLSTATVNNSIFENNQATGNGGGIHALGDITISGTGFIGNAAQNGGGLYSHSGLTLSQSTFDGNTAAQDGGGAYLFYSAAVETSTFANNNAAGDGGGIYFWSEFTLLNCTVSGNTAGGNGGGIYMKPPGGHIDYCTLFGNAATAGNSAYAATHVEFRYAILHDNSGGNNCVFTSSSGGGGNLDSDGSCGYPEGNSLNNVDPLLAPLANNGGSTQTHALMAGSPALDAAGCLVSSDQRGISRPQGALCDIGAYEAEAPIIVTVLPLPTPTILQPVVVGDVDVNCRRGPSTVFEVSGTLFKGQTAPVVGRTDDVGQPSPWVQVLLPRDILCWVWTGNVTLTGDLTLVLVVDTPIPPEPTGAAPPPKPKPTDTAIP